MAFVAAFPVDDDDDGDDDDDQHNLDQHVGNQCVLIQQMISYILASKDLQKRLQRRMGERRL